jgi:hypothetical protein
MARQRRRKRNETSSNEASGATAGNGDTQSEGVTEVESASTQTVTERVGVSKAMAGISSDQITVLLAQTRQKGIYTAKMTEFLSMTDEEGSPVAGIDVGETWPELSGKQASTLKQGFDAVRDKKEAPEGSDQVKVVSQKDEDDEEHVYLINLALVGEQAAVEA